MRIGSGFLHINLSGIVTFAKRQNTSRMIVVTVTEDKGIHKRKINSQCISIIDNSVCLTGIN